MKKLSLSLVVGMFMVVGACNNNGVIDVPSDKNLKELIQTDYKDMTKSEQDKLGLLTGSMSGEEYLQKYGECEIDEQVYGHPILDGITSMIWGKYEKVDIPGAVCGNGSQYKIFVMKAKGFINWLLGNDKKLLIFLEPGGACWDYPSCSGAKGIRGAVNYQGIPDNYMNFGDFIDPNKEGGSPMAAISPLILYNHPTGKNIKTSRWNKIFIPYCTGDIFAGNKVKTYEDPNGEKPPVTWHHVGATNMEKVIEYVKKEFPNMKEVFISGCSAGATGALANYHMFRKALNPDKGYLYSDSGPIFMSTTPEEGNQYYLHQAIKEAWNLDYIFDNLLADFPQYEGYDYGTIHQILAEAYPNDKLASVFFKRDAIFTMYSYERFFNLDEHIPEDFEEVLRLWAEDIDGLVDIYDRYDNLSYFIPYYRKLNSSHCTCIVEFTGTEIGDTGIDMWDFIRKMLSGKPVESYEEDENPDDYYVTSFWIELISMLL